MQDTHIDMHKKPKGEVKINEYFRAVVKLEASDLHLKHGHAPSVRIGGELRHTTSKPLTNEEIEQMIFEIMDEEQIEFFQRHGQLDFAHSLDPNNRFRINVFRQRGYTSVAARRVTGRIPNFEELNLPPELAKICEVRQGLCLVSGVTGSGKSTTIASMIEYINQHWARHIVTVEDPIEYLFVDKKSIINQREIGIDVADYPTALKYLMRTDPDVILIGEMRDKETFQAGLNAAETGHLVFSTVHSSSTYHTVRRILDLYPPDSRDLGRQSLAFNLHSIINMKLLPSIKPGVDRVPAVEILFNNASCRKLIMEQRENELLTVIKSSYDEGMVDFTESLRRLVMKEYVDPKVAYDVAPNPDELKMALRGIRTSTGKILG